MRVLPVAVLAALSLACTSAGSAPQPASTTGASTTGASTTGAGTFAASAPFYLEPGPATPAVIVVNGFTGQKEATIAAPAGAGSFPWVGHTTWYPCGAAPDDRTFLLCGARQYWEVRLGNNGKPQSMAAPADIPVAARNNGTNGDPEFAVSPDRRRAAVTTAAGNIMVLSLVTGATRAWTIPSADGSATSLSWGGDRYLAFQFAPHTRDKFAGGVRVLDTASAATAALAASRLVISGERKLADGITGVFNPVITPDGSKIVAAAWTSFNVAGLAEFSAQTGRFIAMLIPASSMPGHGSPCQVLWTDASGAHLIAYCGTAGVVNGTRFTPVNLHVPNTSGTSFSELLW
jgi:hypothetical protein